MKFLFDLGGVFFDWDPKYYYKNIFSSQDKMEFFLKNVCNDKWNLAQDCGRKIEIAEKELLQKFPEYSDEIKMYYPSHRKMIKKTFNDSIEILKQLKSQEYMCYVLSNWSSETFIGMLDEYPFLREFDDLIISGNEKLIKPNPAIFNLAIKRFQLIPENTVFIDDKKINIEVADKLNFHTIHLLDPYKIKKEIEKFIKLL